MPNPPVVDQVMTRDPSTVSPKDKIRLAVERMIERKCRRLPVVDEGRLVGIITNIDLRRATNSAFVLRERRYDEFLLDHINVEACMTRDPKTVSPQTAIVDAAKLMRDYKVGGLPVVQGDRLVGMVTETDLLNFLITVLEAGT